MNAIIRVVEYYELPRKVGIVTLALAALLCSTAGWAKNRCETNPSLINPLAATDFGIGGTGATVLQSGIGGTGIQDGGIGGTGIKSADIGGTGSPIAQDGGIGGTGIIGIITGFASICVNGIEIHYELDTPVSIDGQPSTAHHLATGQMVIVRANGTGNEVTARDISVVHAVVGPIDHIDTQNGEMRVLGQAVQIREPSGLANLKMGEWVLVSGHRLSNGAVVASRIESSQPLAQARINGYVTHVDAQGVYIDGTRVTLNQSPESANIALGTEISVNGYWDDNNLQAQHIQIDLSNQLISQVEHVVIAGYVPSTPSTVNESFKLGNQTFKLASDLGILSNAADDYNLDQLAPDQLVQVVGYLDVDHDVDHIDQSVSITAITTAMESDTTFSGTAEVGPFPDTDTTNSSKDEHHDSESTHQNVGPNEDETEEDSEHHPEHDDDLEDSTTDEHSEHPDDSEALDTPETPVHEPIDHLDDLEAVDPLDRTDDHLGLPEDLDTFDEPNDHDIDQDIHDIHDGDFDWD